MVAAEEGGGFWREKHFRLVTSAATALATILELTLQTDGQMFCRIPAAGGFIVDEKYD